MKMERYSHKRFFEVVRTNRKLSIAEIMWKCELAMEFPASIHAGMLRSLVMVTLEALPEPEELDWRLL